MYELRPVAADRPHVSPLDAHVGARLQERRTEIGMSQTELARAAGASFRQVQQYECGTNRISASRLWALARALRVPPEYFYQDGAG